MVGIGEGYPFATWTRPVNGRREVSLQVNIAHFRFVVQEYSGLVRIPGFHSCADTMDALSTNPTKDRSRNVPTISCSEEPCRQIVANPVETNTMGSKPRVDSAQQSVGQKYP